VLKTRRAPIDIDKILGPCENDHLILSEALRFDDTRKVPKIEYENCSFRHFMYHFVGALCVTFPTYEILLDCPGLKDKRQKPHSLEAELMIFDLSNWLLYI